MTVTGVRWGTVEDLRNPSFAKPVQFQADGQWHNYSTGFSAEGYTALLTIEFAEGTGMIEFDWIRVTRGGRRIAQWDFA